MKRQSFYLFLLCFLSIGLIQHVAGQNSSMVANFSYKPDWWQTSICLPNDPFKTLVSKEGELLYDFGGKYYKGATHGFGTTVGINVGSMAKWVSQDFDNPAVPVVKTRYRSSEFEIVQEAFAQVTPQALASTKDPISQVRIDRGSFDNNWVQHGNVPEWARSAAVNKNGAIQYQFTVNFDMVIPEVKVALAFYENVASKPGERVMVLEVEGDSARTIDPFKDKGAAQPAIYIIKGKDINRDGRVFVRISPEANSVNKQVFLNAFWVYPGEIQITENDILSGNVQGKPMVVQTCSSSPQGGLISRNDVILVHLKNTTRQRQSLSPEIIIKSSRDVSIDLKSGELSLNEDIVTSTLGMQSVRQIVPGKWVVQLQAVTVEPGQTKSVGLTYHGGTKISVSHPGIEALMAARKQADDYWLKQSNIPLGKVEVPDTTIQALLHSAIRNIWQARDIKKGVPVFQVGPTNYRGLWVVDGAFLMETALMLGATDEVRKGIMYTLDLQKPNGAFQVLRPQFYKENGIVIWTVVHYALLTQDKRWLNENWDHIEKAFAYIEELRKIASEKPGVPWFGINPPGEIDGGIFGWRTNYQYGEYSNAYWNLVGMKAAIMAAHWLDKEQQGAEWQKQYDSFYQQVRKSMERDMRKDNAGNTYVPIHMENATNATPQRAQWVFCHAVYPGQIFDKNDTLVAGNLAMLKNTEQEGMVVGTGWLADGIWNYFASFYGHAWLWQGNGVKAAESLYAMANHAAPTLVWREEHNTADNAYAYIGDMPHNWGSAEFIRLAVHLLALDRGNELHLLEGLPKEWARPGMVTRLKEVATPFGKLTMQLKIGADGKKAVLTTEPLTDRSCRKIVVHQGVWAGNKQEKTLELDPRKPNRIEIVLR